MANKVAGGSAPSSKRQKRLSKERILTRLKNTIRKPHTAPFQSNPLHSPFLHGEEEVEDEPVDTNVDLFDNPEDTQPSDTSGAPEASEETVEQALNISGEVVEALKEIPTLVQCVKDLISAMNRGSDTASSQEMISLGNTAVQVSKSCFRRLNRSRMSLFTQELAVLLFGRDVLGSSSLTGNGSQKQKLHPEKMYALVDTVMSEFPGTTLSEVRAVIRRKCFSAYQLFFLKFI
ncbi:hypothetical protein Q8A67_007258 [Cirrhinus molitorella]|uniref:BEN domain-containing protein n=1 Tax=Cirrhinus molitorella TaxID=172907 RepID=A0AA88PY76_9TELE|nr:hypothetical protein Q8A67_007258 [Cirrhinus molitorella]